MTQAERAEQQGRSSSGKGRAEQVGADKGQRGSTSTASWRACLPLLLRWHCQVRGARAPL